ncbi:MAG: hypothetical protein JW902_09105 [Syntrophaceae bacterium]|nr:hypothetical protein [Syntrophaceae bacterium]
MRKTGNFIKIFFSIFFCGEILILSSFAQGQYDQPVTHLLAQVPPNERDLGRTTNLVPFGWLQIGSREIVLDIQQEGLQRSVRFQAGYLVRNILEEIMKAFPRVYLSSLFIENEIQYFRNRIESSKLPPLLSEADKALLQCLERFEKRKRIEWNCLSGIGKKSMGDYFWSVTMKRLDTSRIFLHAGQQEMPTLSYRMKWEVREYQGGSAIRKHDVRNFSASVRLLDKEKKVVLEKFYPLEPWKNQYIMSATGSIQHEPSSVLSDVILRDIRRGVRVGKYAPLKATAKSVSSIAGTTWAIKEEGRRPFGNYQCMFHANKTYDAKDYRVYKNHQAVYYLRKGAKWEQDGEIIRFWSADMDTEYEGTLVGKGKMIGNARASKGEWRWTADQRTGEIGGRLDLEIFAPLKPSGENVPSIAGTKWEVNLGHWSAFMPIERAYTMNNEEFIFHPDGTYSRGKVYHFAGKKRVTKLSRGDKWEQDGDVIRFWFIKAAYEGRYGGTNEMKGTARTRDAIWTWSAARIRE